MTATNQTTPAKRNAWEADKPFVQVVQMDGKVFLRAFPKSGEAPLVVELEASEALGLSIDLTNKVRVLIERGR